jgi:hypothetical protein
MAFELPPLPNFQTNIPQPPSALDTYGKLLQLKSLQGEQALQPLQMQEQQERVKQQQLQTQQMQLEQQSQQAMMKAWSDPEFTKNFTGTDEANASGVGFDPDAMTKGLIQKGVLPKDAMAMTSSFVDRSQKIATTLKDQGQTGEAIANIRQKTFQSLGDKFGSIIDQSKKDPTKAAAALTAFQSDLATNPGAYKGLTQQEMAELHSATTLDHLPAVAGLMGFEGSIADYHKKVADAASAANRLAGPNGELSVDDQQDLKKQIALQTNPEVQQGKVAVSAAEGAARGKQDVVNEVAKAQAEAPTLDSLTQTTRAGRKYIDASQLPPVSASLMRQQAAQQGIPVVNKDQADALSQIDTAKANQQYMLDVLSKKLASGAPERLWYGPANTIEKMAQSDPEMAAVGTFRNAAIQSMRAVAGAKGLRINQAEIEMAIDNDIPKLTDTLPVAQAKLKNLQQFLENNEQSMLVRNRQQGASGAGAAQPGAGDFFSQFGGKKR